MNFDPTDAAPGSAEKIEALRLRHENGLQLWHKDDRTDFAALGWLGNQIFTSKERKEKRPGKQIVKLMLSGRKMRDE